MNLTMSVFHWAFDIGGMILDNLLINHCTFQHDASQTSTKPPGGCLRQKHAESWGYYGGKMKTQILDQRYKP